MTWTARGGNTDFDEFKSMMHVSKPLVALTVAPVLHVSALRSTPLVLQYPSCLNDRSLDSSLGLPHKSTHRLQSSRGFVNSAAAPSTFRYRIGASFSAKGIQFNPKKDLYSFEPAKHDSEKAGQAKKHLDSGYNTGRGASGQDAFFVSQLGDTRNVAFGVADGVGGWAESGIDPAHFSHGLCQNMIDVARSTTNSQAEDLRASTLLKEGYERVVADESVEGGGSTACIAVGRDNGTLEVAK